ncbi:hypothetical protein QVZ41_02050 [Wenyingzhuangia sp. chi5]|uniref:O-antigen ligase-like membrane protein n=1 Tax=Wenyingzhuangia gilva TaxID=3057677 RepID=A0ABT8VNT1_9FLAO|nr:hypothetical protein [Wenyingzhuangia sp. chi5]MDO3693630.1 hypothetical protein [Wenyingzhuangia sp. chi5]
MNASKIAKYSVLLCFVPFIFNFFFYGRTAVVTMLCSYPLMLFLILFNIKSPKTNLDSKTQWILNIFIFLNLTLMCRGIIDMTSLQDKKVIFSSTIPTMIFLPLSIYLFSEGIQTIKMAFRAFMLNVLLFATILLFKRSTGTFDYAHAVGPIYLLIIFMPYLQKKWRLIVLLVAFISFFNDLSVRANLLNIMVAFLISFTFYFRNLEIMYKLIKTFRRILLYVPVFLLFLGLTGGFNIFKIGEYVGSYELDTGDYGDQEVTVDSRTGIYTDVFSALNKKDALLFGLGANGKTKTYLSKVSWGDLKKIYAEGRRATESGMLNYIQWGGFLGMFCYLVLFIRASYLGVYKSNNWLCICLGLWVAYKSMFSFIEDRLFFSIYSLFLFIPIAMCLNNDLRKLNDKEILFYIRNMFNSNYTIKY